MAPLEQYSERVLCVCENGNDWTNDRNEKGFITIKFETKHFNLDFIWKHESRKKNYIIFLQ